MSALDSGFIMLLLTIVIAIGSPIAGKWIDRVGNKTPNIVSMILFTIACFLLIFLKITPIYPIFISALILVGIATAIAFVSTLTGSLLQCDPEMQGVASGMLFTIAWLGCALGVSIMGSILAMTGDNYLTTQIQDLGFTLSSKQTEIAQRVVSGVSSFKNLSSYFSSKMLATITKLVRGSFVHGFRVSMLAFMFMSIVGVILSLFLKKIKPDHNSENITPPV